MDIHTYFSELGKKSASRLTPDERKQRASNAAHKRWMTSNTNANGKHKEKEVANGKHEEVEEKHCTHLVRGKFICWNKQEFGTKCGLHRI